MGANKKTLYNTDCVTLINDFSFIYITHNDLIFCAVVRRNCNVFSILSFQYQLIEIINQYLNETINSILIQSNFILILELLHEMINGGYPQSLPDNDEILDYSLLPRNP